MGSGKPLDEAAWLAAMRFWMPRKAASHVSRWFGGAEMKLAVFALDLLGPGETGRGGLAADVADCCGWNEAAAGEVLDELVATGAVVRLESAGEVRYFNDEAAIVEKAGVLFSAAVAS